MYQIFEDFLIETIFSFYIVYLFIMYQNHDRFQARN